MRVRVPPRAPNRERSNQRPLGAALGFGGGDSCAVFSRGDAIGGSVQMSGPYAMIVPARS